MEPNNEEPPAISACRASPSWNRLGGVNHRHHLLLGGHDQALIATQHKITRRTSTAPIMIGTCTTFVRRKIEDATRAKILARYSVECGRVGVTSGALRTPIGLDVPSRRSPNATALSSTGCAAERGRSLVVRRAAKPPERVKKYSKATVATRPATGGAAVAVVDRSLRCSSSNSRPAETITIATTTGVARCGDNSPYSFEGRAGRRSEHDRT
jgi:hypothetical protein